MDRVKKRAYCSPGGRHDATWTLAVKGESVDKLSETPLLDPGTVVVARDVPLPMPKIEFPEPINLRAMALFQSAPILDVRRLPLISGI